MALRELTSDEKQMIAVGLNLRCNLIETGCPTLSARDMERMDPKDAWRDHGAKLRALRENQMKLILNSKDLQRKMYNGQVYIDD